MTKKRATDILDFTRHSALAKARPGLYRHSGDRYPGLYLNVGKRRSSWYLKARVGGKMKSVKVGGYPELDARSAYEHSGLQASQSVNATVIRTVRDGWLFWCETSLATGSMSEAHAIDMTSKLERHASEILDMNPADVSSALVQQTVNRLASQGKIATARHVRAGLAAAFNFAGLPNPVSNKRVRAPKPRVAETRLAAAARSRGLDSSDWSPIWGAIEAKMSLNHRVGTAWLVMLFTGLRSGNVRALKWSHIDINEKTIHLPRMKNGVVRTLPVANTVVDALSALDTLDEVFVFPARSKTGYVDHLDPLKTSDGFVILRQHDTRRHFMQAAAEAMIPDYVAHFLRGDVMAGAGNDMLMKYLKAVSDRRAVDAIEAAIHRRMGTNGEM